MSKDRGPNLRRANRRGSDCREVLTSKVNESKYSSCFGRTLRRRSGSRRSWRTYGLIAHGLRATMTSWTSADSAGQSEVGLRGVGVRRGSGKPRSTIVTLWWGRRSCEQARDPPVHQRDGEPSSARHHAMVTADCHSGSADRPRVAAAVDWHGFRCAGDAQAQGAIYSHATTVSHPPRCDRPSWLGIPVYDKDASSYRRNANTAAFICSVLKTLS